MFVIKYLKHCSVNFVISNLKGEEIVGTFNKNELQRKKS